MAKTKKSTKTPGVLEGSTLSSRKALHNTPYDDIWGIEYTIFSDGVVAHKYGDCFQLSMCCGKVYIASLDDSEFSSADVRKMKHVLDNVPANVAGKLPYCDKVKLWARVAS